MAPVAPLQTGRFLRLARRSVEVWQCAFRRLPMWIDHETDPDAPPTRAFGFVCRSVRTGLVHVGMPESRDAAALADCAVNTLQEFGLKWQKQLEGRPAAIQVEDRVLKDALEARRADLDADVVLVPSLPELTAVLRDLQEGASGDTRPNLLDDPAITVQMVRAFAEVAAEFHRAAPWRLFDNADLIIVEHGGVPRSVSRVSVMGAGGEEFGLAFYETQAQFERLMDGRVPERAFGVTFEPCDGLPFGDVDLWEDEHLPVDGDEGYPLAAEFRARGVMRRPTSDELAAIEGLLRAIATVTEEELDRGTWNTSVSTSRGPLQLTLTLPEVVEALDPTTVGPSSLGDRDRIQRQMAALLSSREFGSIEDANAALQQALISGQFDKNTENEVLSPTDEAREWEVVRWSGTGGRGQRWRGGRSHWIRTVPMRGRR